PLAALYPAQGAPYLAYMLWRAVFHKASFYRAPPALIFLYEVYLLSVLFASLYFFYVSYGLLRGRRQVNKFLLVTSSFSAVLWFLPAILSLGNASTYLTAPNMPPDIKASWVEYLGTGVFFSAIGIMNIASILNIVYHLKKRR
ncbi:MAG: hypothetical protein NWE76_02180, partial [Candidatus Bathyarchaeota archaeon]|nr:hypothetical protein [Candidatus Bathyarchaeota archaeon]